MFFDVAKLVAFVEGFKKKKSNMKEEMKLNLAGLEALKANKFRASSARVFSNRNSAILTESSINDSRETDETSSTHSGTNTHFMKSKDLNEKGL